MAEKKLTKREMFEGIKAKYDLTDKEVEFIDHEIDLLSRKNSKDRKPSAQQVANEGIKVAIVKYLTNEGCAKTITEIIKGAEDLAELSNQRVSALCRQLIDEGKIVRTEDKRKAYFSLV